MVDIMKLTTSNAGLPMAFIILYGSGFIGTKYGLSYANPLSFLSWRFFLASLILLLLALVTSNLNKHSFKNSAHIAVAGLLTVGLFSIGVFESMAIGMSPALSALIIALQPIFIGILAKRVVGETLSRLQWLGLVLGLIGVAWVVYDNIEFDSVGLASVALSVLGLFSLTAGNLYQKKFCSNMNLFVGGAIQSFVSALACILLLLLISEYRVLWSGEFVLALGYMTIGVSVGALSLLYLMIRYGSLSKVASLFYLVPVVAALASYFFLNETFSSVTVVGIVIVVMGLLLANHSKGDNEK